MLDYYKHVLDSEINTAPKNALFNSVIMEGLYTATILKCSNFTSEKVRAIYGKSSEIIH